MDEVGAVNWAESSAARGDQEPSVTESPMDGSGLSELATATAEFVRLLNARTDRSVLLKVLLARDSVDHSLQATTPNPADVFRLLEPDERLRKEFAALDDETLDQIESWRSSLKIPDDKWWWRPDNGDSTSALLPLFSGFCLAITFAIIADVGRKLLIGSSDTVALLTIFVQVTLTLLATSTYSAAGGKALEKLLRQIGIPRRMRPLSKPSLALLVLLIVLLSSHQLPRLGDYYYKRAMSELKSHNDLSAQQHLVLAGSINPDDPAVHYNTAAMKQNLADVDGAISEYRLAIKLKPDFYPAHLNLADLLLASKSDAANALGILLAIKEPLESDPKYKAYLYSLHKGLGWAYFILNSNDLARIELSKASVDAPDKPAPYCLLGKMDLAEGKEKGANTDFLSCVGRAHQAVGGAEVAWVAEAQTFLGSKW